MLEFRSVNKARVILVKALENSLNRSSSLSNLANELLSVETSCVSHVDKSRDILVLSLEDLSAFLRPFSIVSEGIDDHTSAVL